MVANEARPGRSDDFFQTKHLAYMNEPRPTNSSSAGRQSLTNSTAHEPTSLGPTNVHLLWIPYVLICVGCLTLLAISFFRYHVRRSNKEKELRELRNRRNAATRYGPTKRLAAVHVAPIIQRKVAEVCHHGGQRPRFKGFITPNTVNPFPSEKKPDRLRSEIPTIGEEEEAFGVRSIGRYNRRRTSSALECQMYDEDSEMLQNSQRLRRNQTFKLKPTKRTVNPTPCQPAPAHQRPMLLPYIVNAMRSVSPTSDERHMAKRLELKEKPKNYLPKEGDVPL